MTGNGRPVSNTVAVVPRNRPGFRRLGLGGFVLSLVSTFTAWSLLFALLGIRALDFAIGATDTTIFGLHVASHPGPFVVNEVAVPLLLAVVAVGVPAILGIVGGGRLWLGWAGPRWALIACLAWETLAIAVVLAGGTPGLFSLATALFALIGSGAWAGRRPGSGVLDLFRRGG